MPGVIALVDIPNGVAIAADSWWRAHLAIEALNIRWDYGANVATNSAAIAT